MCSRAACLCGNDGNGAVVLQVTTDRYVFGGAELQLVSGSYPRCHCPHCYPPPVVGSRSSPAGGATTLGEWLLRSLLPPLSLPSLLPRARCRCPHCYPQNSSAVALFFLEGDVRLPNLGKLLGPPKALAHICVCIL